MKKFLFSIFMIVALVSCEGLGDLLDDGGDDYNHDNNGDDQTGVVDNVLSGTHDCWLWDIHNANYFEEQGIKTLPQIINITYSEDLTTESCGALLEIINSVELNIDDLRASGFQLNFMVNKLNYSEYTLASDLFAGCENIDNLTFDNIATVESGAFKDCRFLRSVFFKNCYTFGERIFEGCDSLNHITMEAPEDFILENDKTFDGINTQDINISLNDNKHSDGESKPKVEANQVDWAGYSWKSINGSIRNEGYYLSQFDIYCNPEDSTKVNYVGSGDILINDEGEITAEDLEMFIKVLKKSDLHFLFFNIYFPNATKFADHAFANQFPEEMDYNISIYAPQVTELGENPFEGCYLSDLELGIESIKANQLYNTQISRLFVDSVKEIESHAFTSDYKHSTIFMRRSDDITIQPNAFDDTQTRNITLELADTNLDKVEACNVVAFGYRWNKINDLTETQVFYLKDVHSNGEIYDSSSIYYNIRSSYFIILDEGVISADAIANFRNIFNDYEDDNRSIQITLPNATELGDEFFKMDGHHCIFNFYIPKVTKIGRSAFENVKLSTEYDTFNSVVEIGDRAFANSSYSLPTYGDDNNTFHPINSIYILPKATKLGAELFVDNFSLSSLSLTVNDNIEIDPNALEGLDCSETTLNLCIDKFNLDLFQTTKAETSLHYTDTVPDIAPGNIQTEIINYITRNYPYINTHTPANTSQYEWMGKRWEHILWIDKDNELIQNIDELYEF